MTWPRIVAEALRQIDGHAHVAGRGAANASLAAVLEAIEAARTPPRNAMAPPPFLYPHQHDSWRRVTAALDAWHAALLLEGVGSGKTWIALAVAANERRPVVAIVPAILQPQWAAAAARAKVAIRLWSHERASRGTLPPIRPGLVIIDEAHRFRDLSTRRTQTVAPWLVGRRVLLLTATPIVNRLGDLIALLRLVLPDDALALSGIPRLQEIESAELPPVALRRLAIRSAERSLYNIGRELAVVPVDATEEGRGAVAVAAIAQLQLSVATATRRLLASVLLDAAASSNAALLQALRRYRALLLQSRDAGGASRAMLRRFAGENFEQLVLWPMLAPDGLTDLPTADIARVEQLIATLRSDEAWIGSLIERCRDNRPTVWFTRHRATAQLLRRVAGDDAAWITGSEAGIGPHRMARGGVLAAFGPDRAAWSLRKKPPQMLIATDVAAEGLDLQAAGRIVHVDLPWTAMRLEQREGRLLRIGQMHPQVDVIVRSPARCIETALAPQARLRRKGALAARWLHELEDGDATTLFTSQQPLLVLLEGSETDIVAIRMRQGGRTGLVMMTRHGTGSWLVGDQAAAAVTGKAGHAMPARLSPAGIAAVFAAAVRAAIAAARGASPPSAALIRRVHRLARVAASRRDGNGLRSLDRMLRFASAPTTHGGRAIITALLELGDREFLRRDVPDASPPDPIEADVVAAILFRSTIRPA